MIEKMLRDYIEEYKLNYIDYHYLEIDKFRIVNDEIEFTIGYNVYHDHHKEDHTVSILNLFAWVYSKTLGSKL